jgi:hypothetical protein
LSSSGSCQGSVEEWWTWTSQCQAEKKFIKVKKDRWPIRVFFSTWRNVCHVPVPLACSNSPPCMLFYPFLMSVMLGLPAADPKMPGVDSVFSTLCLSFLWASFKILHTAFILPLSQGYIPLSPISPN